MAARDAARVLPLLSTLVVLAASEPAVAVPRAVATGAVPVAEPRAGRTGSFQVTCPAERSYRPTELIPLRYAITNVPEGTTMLFYEWAQERAWPLADVHEEPGPGGGLTLVFTVAVPETATAGRDSIALTVTTNTVPPQNAQCGHVLRADTIHLAPLVACARDTTFMPGRTLEVSYAITNALPSAQFIFWTLTSDRGWALPHASGSVFLDGDSTDVIPFTIEAPDTAAEGPGQLRFRAQLTGARTDADSCTTVLAYAPVGVEPPAAPGNVLALAGARPNPTSRGLVVWLGLPDARPARLEVFDVRGRRVLVRDLRGMRAGTHAVDLGDATLPAGIYLLRLTQGPASRSARAVVVQ